jgi:hypothetical protein
MIHDTDSSPHGKIVKAVGYCQAYVRRMRMIKVRLALLWLVILPVAWTGTAAANPFEYNWQELAPGVWAGIRQDPFELPQEGNSVFVVTDLGVSPPSISPRSRTVSPTAIRFSGIDSTTM